METLIKSKLINEAWFYADDWNLPELFPESFDFKNDATWHEFGSIEHTNELPNTTLKIVSLIEAIDHRKNI